jgi:uncharacterized membrane protein YkvI
MRANAIFSLVSGLTILTTARLLSDVLAPVTPFLLRLLGCGLLLYTFSLLRSASRPEISRREAWAAVIMDSLWVAASIALIVSGLLTTAGDWIVGVVADIVTLFALLQYLGLRRARRTAALPLFAGVLSRAGTIHSGTSRRADH